MDTTSTTISTLTEEEITAARLLIDAATLINDRESRERVAAAFCASAACEFVQLFVKNPHETYTDVVITATPVEEDEDYYEDDDEPRVVYTFDSEDGLIDAWDVSHESEPYQVYASAWYWPDSKPRPELSPLSMLALFASMTDDQWTAYNFLCDQEWNIPALEVMTRRAALAALGLLPASYLAEFASKYPDLLHWFSDYLHVLGL